MATYFHGTPEIQQDGLQTLYLMNLSYTDAAAPPANMVLLNSMNPMNLVQANQLPTHHQQQQQQQHFVGIPLQASASTAAPPQYNLWAQPSSNNTVDITSQFSPRRPPVPMTAPSQQALSLSLSPRDMPGPAVALMSPGNANEAKMAAMMAPSSSMAGTGNGVASLQSFLLGSKYLKAAQHLLDEVVNVGKGIKDDAEKGASSKNPMKSANKDADGTGTGAAAEEETSGKRGADLTTAERQELQMKKAKLVNMLDEVEHRYRQYHQQMQLVVSSFEAVAGYGSAKTYTALALQTISKQFRCLRDAITGQIRATSKSLGEEDPKSGGSRLRFVDHHLRQQRALQQLGMMQHNAWRPQRGLPERSVSILRAWLFEHFLHPYPKDSDKLMLAKQTGLTRSQVSNWFINARVRLWKPMVEEMYTEEFKDQEQNNTDENTSKSDANGSLTPKSGAQQESSPTVAGSLDSLKNKPSQPLATLQQSTLVNGSNQADYYDHEAILQPGLKKARSDESLHGNPVLPSVNVEAKPDQVSNQDFLLKFMEGRQRVEDQGYHLLPGTTSHGGHYGAYPIGDLARFDGEQFGAPHRFSGNGVSLTLGLPHCDNLSLSAAQPSFLSNEGMQLGRRLEMSNEAGDYCSLNSNATVAHSSNAYDSIALQNRKRFAAQLLPDFVS